MPEPDVTVRTQTLLSAVSGKAGLTVAGAGQVSVNSAYVQLGRAAQQVTMFEHVQEAA
jgi:hypothetical protein